MISDIKGSESSDAGPILSRTLKYMHDHQIDERTVEVVITDLSVQTPGLNDDSTSIELKNRVHANIDIENWLKYKNQKRRHIYVEFQLHGTIAAPKEHVRIAPGKHADV